MKITHWILRFYPPQWRERYEQEMLSVLEGHHITLLTVLDLLLGALDARLDPYYRSEKNPLVPQSVQATTLIFVAILALATFLLDRWQVMVTSTFPMQPAGSLAGSLLSYSITNMVLYGEYLLLLIFTLSITVNIIKKARTARRRGPVIAVAVCVLLPVLLSSAYAMTTFGELAIEPVSMFISGKVSFLLLLLLTSCSLFTFVVKFKETLAAPQKRVLFLIMSLVLFVSFGFYFFYPHMNLSLVMGVSPSGVHFEGIARLVPFVSIGTLMLTIGIEGSRWWNMRARLISLATVLAVGIIGNLIAVFAWYVNFWTTGVSGLYGGQEPSIFMLVALAATSVLLLFLLLRGWMLATNKQSVALPQEQQISR